MAFPSPLYPFKRSPLPNLSTRPSLETNQMILTSCHYTLSLPFHLIRPNHEFSSLVDVLLTPLHIPIGPPFSTSPCFVKMNKKLYKDDINHAKLKSQKCEDHKIISLPCSYKIIAKVFFERLKSFQLQNQLRLLWPTINLRCLMKSQQAH